MLTDRKIWLGLSFAGMMVATIPAASAQQQTTGTPGTPDATTTIDGRVSSASARAIWRNDQSRFQKLQTILAADRGAAQRCAQRLADYD